MPCFCWSGVGFAFSCFFRSLGLLCKCLFRSLDCFYIQSLRAFRRAELFDFSFVVPEFLWYLQEGLRFQQQSLVRTRYHHKLILGEVQGVVQGVLTCTFPIAARLPTGRLSIVFREPQADIAPP